MEFEIDVYVSFADRTGAAEPEYMCLDLLEEFRWQSLNSLREFVDHLDCCLSVDVCGEGRKKQHGWTVLYMLVITGAKDDSTACD